MCILAQRSRYRIEEPSSSKSGGASRASLGLDFWGPGDEWLDAASGIELDLVYFDTAWMTTQLQRVLKEYKASLGYSTCLWYTLRHSLALYDPNGWFANLQEFANVEYPEPLRANIIAFNHPVLREIIPSYANQLKKAIHRKDLVSVNHRLAALLASYFDIIFAFNRQLHPGRKGWWSMRKTAAANYRITWLKIFSACWQLALLVILLARSIWISCWTVWIVS